jgi:ectoine hydroxylase-related dioxygenase (phytanoyl-CoA dioxygenase family)
MLSAAAPWDRIDLDGYRGPMAVPDPLAPPDAGPGAPLHAGPGAGPGAVLDAEVVARFGRDGYVRTDGLLDRAEVERYGSAIDRAVADRTVGDRRALVDKSAYEQSFVQCMRLWETDDDVRPLTFHPTLARAAAELLGVEAVRLWQDQALYKEPGGRPTDPHQDAPFWPIGDAPLISAWIPLAPSTEANGALGYVPGSHRLGRLRTVDLTRPDVAHDILADPALDGGRPVTVEAEVGSVVWHHGWTVHGAGPNTTDTTRRAFTIVYLADGYRRAKPWPNFPLDRAEVEVGAPMEGDGLPLAWPRPDGDLPDPPDRRGEPTGPQQHVTPS